MDSAVREIRRIIVHLIIFLQLWETVGLYTCGVSGSLDHVALHEGRLCGSVCIPMSAQPEQTAGQETQDILQSTLILQDR